MPPADIDAFLEVVEVSDVELLLRFVWSIVVVPTETSGLGGRCRIPLSSFVHPLVTLLAKDITITKFTRSKSLLELWVTTFLSD